MKFFEGLSECAEAFISFIVLISRCAADSASARRRANCARSRESAACSWASFKRSSRNAASRYSCRASSGLFDLTSCSSFFNGLTTPLLRGQVNPAVRSIFPRSSLTMFCCSATPCGLVSADSSWRSASSRSALSCSTRRSSALPLGVPFSLSGGNPPFNVPQPGLDL